MKPSDTKSPSFARPLIDFASAVEEVGTVTGTESYDFEWSATSKQLLLIQSLYEQLPSCRQGQWFLSTSYESGRHKIQHLCKELADKVITAAANICEEQHPDQFSVLLQLGLLLKGSSKKINQLEEPYNILRERPRSKSKSPWESEEILSSLDVTNYF